MAGYWCQMTNSGWVWVVSGWVLAGFGWVRVGSGGFGWVTLLVTTLHIYSTEILRVSSTSNSLVSSTDIPLLSSCGWNAYLLVKQVECLSSCKTELSLPKLHKKTRWEFKLSYLDEYLRIQLFLVIRPQ